MKNTEYNFDIDSQNKSTGTRQDGLEITRRILVSATFTVSPILSGLNFWKEQLDLIFTTEILSYNQIFQAIY